ncbi:MAG: alanine--tRNA ligase [Candidatus Omnitrophica bacterium]|nr:alanine--tRNA ligase [Candidatus Omnitrophota bacterium]
MNTNILRKKYLDFFKSRNHVYFATDTLVPDDASLLFTSAGMNQFKPYFLGEKKGIKRATSCQKCLRTGDIERVGKTAYHHTFFEMLGNFSFGDYFKKEAIELAWEFLTKELGMKEGDLWVSVYKDDQEAYDIWKNAVKVPEARIIRLGENSNFWPANAPSLGPDGPCGPCSEIFFDQGSGVGCKKDNCNPDCSCGRFVEVWNLVFTQFNRVGENRLEPLPQKNIDTGMGLERMACVLQSKQSNFDIDILKPLVDEVYAILKVKNKDQQSRELVNAIVDHLRAAAFAVADGVYPSNEERGYVIRKIIRKAVYSANLLGYKKSFGYKLVPLLGELMGEFYPEIKEKAQVIEKIIKAEEDKFLSTLLAGQQQLKAELEKTKQAKKNILDAGILFRLYDTFGFPLELSKDIAQKQGISVDQQGFEELLRKQQERSRKQSMFDENIFSSKDFSVSEESEFVGYEIDYVKTKVVRIFSGQEEVSGLSAGEEGIIVLKETPFYPESGGQLADTGAIFNNNGEFSVEKAFRIGKTILHKGRVLCGKIEKDIFEVSINTSRRRALARAHTATHLLQSALRKVLGEHVAQQGSLVDEDRFRFDFTHLKALTSDEIEKIEDMVNGYILEADKVNKEVLTLEEAKKRGALAFFKDKYSNEVRVVSIAGYSMELCGGTHLDNTSQAGSFFIESESSIASGIRRIEAVVGYKAYLASKEIRKAEDLIKEKLKAKDVFTAVDGLKLRADSLAAELEAQKKKNLFSEIGQIRENIKKISQFSFLVFEIPGQDYDALLSLSDEIKRKEERIFIFLTSKSDRDIFICSASDVLVKKGFSCKKFINDYRKDLGLRGGGRENSAQGVIEERGDDFFQKLEEYFKESVS